jgi:hypothetical protein
MTLLAGGKRESNLDSRCSASSKDNQSEGEWGETPLKSQAERKVCP